MPVSVRDATKHYFPKAHGSPLRDWYRPMAATLASAIAKPAPVTGSGAFLPNMRLRAVAASATIAIAAVTMPMPATS
jgi:hypothetical protein